MTKKDLRTVVISGGIGIGAILALWWFARRSVVVPVIEPGAVKWEPH